MSSAYIPTYRRNPVPPLPGPVLWIGATGNLSLCRPCIAKYQPIGLHVRAHAARLCAGCLRSDPGPEGYVLGPGGSLLDPV